MLLLLLLIDGGRLGAHQHASRCGRPAQLLPGRRFSLAYLSREEFLEQLRAAQGGDGPATIVIPCSRQEFEQFAEIEPS